MSYKKAIAKSCILLFSKDNKIQDFVEFVKIKSMNELQEISEKLIMYPNDKCLGKRVDFAQMNPDIKWRKYYQNYDVQVTKNLVPLSLYGKVVRGIATGANEYFTFNVEKQKKYAISQEYLLPCISQAKDIKCDIFTSSHFEQLKNQGENVFLLNANAEKLQQDENLFKYIKIGEKQEINLRYLTKHKNTWYNIENRKNTLIWISVFNRSKIKFIKNEAGVKNLTCFHCVYLDDLYQDKTDILFAYLLTDVAAEILNQNRREYGNGLKKFEPNDLNNGFIIKLDQINTKQEKEILEIYNLYRNSVPESKHNQNFINELNEIFAKII